MEKGTIAAVVLIIGVIVLLAIRQIQGWSLEGFPVIGHTAITYAFIGISIAIIAIVAYLARGKKSKEG